MVEASLTADVATLSEAVQAADPSARLVSPWLIRKIIAHDRGINSVFAIPHDESHVIPTARLAQIAHDEDLPLEFDLPASPLTILIARPPAAGPDEDPSRPFLLTTRRLFHGRIHAVLAAGTVSDGAVQCRLEELGRSFVVEARFVLQRERMLAAGAADRELYFEAAAVFAELHHFDRPRLAVYFASAGSDDDAARILAVFQRDVDTAAVLKSSWLEGASACDAAAQPPPPFQPGKSAQKRRQRDAGRADRLLKRAGKAAAAGNDVRAAILAMRVSRAHGDDAASRAGALRHLNALVVRLKDALRFDEHAAREWREALMPLMANAGGGWWNAEGRLLYDLQKACFDHERPIYSINTLGWLFSFGRRPLRVPIPRQRVVLISRHLRSAFGRLLKARLTAFERARLERLMHESMHGAEEEVRADFRRDLAQSLSEGGISAFTAVERAAERKLVEELLDTIIRRGYLTMGELRDGVSRNQVKFDDGRGWDMVLGRQHMLRLNRAMKARFPGVYRGGEIYLRFFQWIGSILFATATGRLLTRFILLPFGGAYILLEGFDHTIGHIIHAAAQVEIATSNKYTLALLGIYLVGMVNSASFRAASGRVFSALWACVKGVLYTGPRWVATRPAVRAFFASRAFRFIGRYGIKPLIFATVAWPFIPHDAQRHTEIAVLAGAFLAANLILNSRAVHWLEQWLIAAFGAVWRFVTVDILAELFRAVTRFFAMLLEDVERAIYAVDEWLRFRGNRGRAGLAVAATLAVFWFFATYFVRFCISLLVEPQINPIKHFPVVTVSHKLIWSQVPNLIGVLEKFGLDTYKAGAILTSIAFAIPGVFGFLAWELKENWRLYRANRPKALKPVHFGSHGETLARLLRPGLHSGTLPKTFAKLRKAQARPHSRRAGNQVRKQQEALEHIREAVEHFVTRESLGLVNMHAPWNACPVEVSHVRLWSTGIAVSFRHHEAPGEDATIVFEQESRWIIARMERAGWTAALPEQSASMFTMMLLGLCKTAGVDVVREQVDAVLGPVAHCEFTRAALLAWKAGAAAPIEVNLHDPPAALRPIVLRNTPLEWSDWVAVWDARPAPAAHAPLEYSTR